MMQVQIFGTSGCMGCLGQDEGDGSSDGSSDGSGGGFDWKGLMSSAKTAIGTAQDAYKSINSGGKPAGATATTVGGTDPYKSCANLTSALAKSQCMAHINRALNLRAAGKQQQSMGAMKTPTSSGVVGTAVTILVIAGFGLAIWKLL